MKRLSRDFTRGEKALLLLLALVLLGQILHAERRYSFSFWP